MTNQIKLTHCVEPLTAKEKEIIRWKQFGEKCRNTRLALGITLVELATKVGCSPKTLSKFEAGKKLLWRRVIETGYDTAIKLIMAERQAILDQNL
ncbi:MAG: helix-turn-helix transcriptional regulator [Anaerovibrio sp.]|nr:helix-turn-helix transcriptional regulator [Anaerovibrio sp.]